MFDAGVKNELIGTDIDLKKSIIILAKRRQNSTRISVK